MNVVRTLMEVHDPISECDESQNKDVQWEEMNFEQINLKG